MRLSDLLRSHVVDADGNDLGSIDDVLLVQDGPLLDPFGAALRVEGLIVGGPAPVTRLGYHRGGVEGPWLLRVLFRALERRARYVPWEQVESWDADLVRISARGADLQAP